MKIFLFSFVVVLTLYCCGKQSNSRVQMEVENGAGSNTSVVNSTTDPVAVNHLIISENHLGEIPLPFPDQEMTASLDETFNSYSVTREVGQQDGPDFDVYSIKDGSVEQLYFEMDWEDPKILNAVYISGPSVKDEYGLSVGDSVDKVKKLRDGELKVDSNFHFHTYVYFDNSNIVYEVATDGAMPHSIDVENTQYGFEQLKSWRIQHIIWRDRRKVNQF